uniref:Uncharacterized protein n=1 Tax=Poecilia formosa TaxID=48698 RepID=A0A096MBI6_POEFO
ANSPVNSGFPRIPRANTSSNWGSKANLEMTPSNSRQNLFFSGGNSRFNNDQDDMFSFSQIRPKINPYEQLQSRSSTYSPYRATNPY